MSLVVWLPLNGDLTQQGTENTTFSGTPAWKTYGKIGNAALNLQNKITCTTTALNGVQFFSVTFWARIENNPDSTANWMDVIGFTDQTSSGTGGQFRFETGYGNSAYSGIHWHDNATNAIINGSYTYNTGTEFDKWHHIAVTVSDTEVCSYYDGILKSTLTTNLNKGHLTGAWWLGESTTRGCIQDVRIYDNTLSAAEVREIAQGLVLHYKLSDIVFPNYLVNSNFWNGTSNWYGVNGSTITTTTINNIKVGTGTKGTSNNIIGQTATYEYTANTTIDITVSARVYVEETGTFGVGNWITTTQVSGWQGISGTRTYNNNQLIAGWHTITSTLKNATNQYTGKIVTAFSFTGTTFYITNVKLEINSVATAWCMSSSENITNLNTVPDSSGYNHNGTIVNTVSISSDTPRHSCSTKLEATNSMINCGRGGMVTDSITVNFWCKYSSWGNPVSCTEGGGWNMENNGGSITFPVYISSVGYVTSKNGTGAEQLPPANYANAWHMFTGSYNKAEKTVSLYIDGELKQQNIASAGNNIAYNSSNCIWIGAEATGSNTTASNGMAGLFSDFRIYCTALDADAIRQLYEVGAKVDNKNNVHSFELNENNQNEITKTGILKCSTFSEFNGMSFLKYDPNVYIEPDGSCWVRVFHHNNPGAGSFSSGNDFAHSVYIDENRWFNVELANYLDKWEIMVKGKFTATSDEWKLRWIQQYNPMTATYANVAVANVTKITTSGYSSSPASWGGLYLKNGLTYLCANNGTNGNWWGAVGSYSVYQGGIPGWGPSGTITTTGFNDVYLRIDNVTFTTLTAKNTKNKIWTGSEFIEL